jgi:hypothetical protein
MYTDCYLNVGTRDILQYNSLNIRQLGRDLMYLVPFTIISFYILCIICLEQNMSYRTYCARCVCS